MKLELYKLYKTIITLRIRIKKIFLTFAACLAIFLSGEIKAEIGFRTSEDDVFTLYRSSVVLGGETWRIHFATFDSSDGEAYNLENCEVTKSLIQKQPMITVRYWCEKGYFRK